MKKVYVAIMGLGTVGKGTYDDILDSHDKIAAVYGLDLVVKRVLDKNEARFGCLPDGVGTTSVDDIISDSEISIVVETMGGVEPAKTFITRAFNSGKSVVSANKELIAKHWEELQDCAERNGVGFYFEASCVGAVPIIRVLNESVRNDTIEAVYGIINGTTNYILSKMTHEGVGYQEALKQAQELGYAEFNPEADVEGYDAGYKLAILSTMAYDKRVRFSKEDCHGITGVTRESIEYAKGASYAIKLIAESRMVNGELCYRVHPMAVKNTHMLAAVEGAMNGVWLHCKNAGGMMLYGYGAGSRQTGSAILSDVVYCAEKSRHIYYNLKENARVGKNMDYARFIVVPRVDEEIALSVLSGELYEAVTLPGAKVIVTKKMNDERWLSKLNELKEVKILCQFEALV